MRLHPLAITLLLPIQASSSRPFSSLSNFKVEEPQDIDLIAKTKKKGFFNFEINDEDSYEIDETIVDEFLPEDDEVEEEEDMLPVKKSIWRRKKTDASDEELREEEEEVVEDVAEEGDDDSDDIVQEESMIESEAETKESIKESKSSWFGIRNIVEEQIEEAEVDNTEVDTMEEEDDDEAQPVSKEKSSWFGGKKSVEAKKDTEEEESLDKQEEGDESTTAFEETIDEEETKISKSEERRLKKEELRKQKAQEKQQKLEEKKKAIEEKKQEIQDLKKERQAKKAEKEDTKKRAKANKLEKSKQKEEKEVDGKKEETKDESKKSDTPQNAKPSMPPMMDNGLSPGPLLIIPPPTMPRNSRQFGSPGGPPTSTDATMVGILSVIVPLISRLVVLTLCSSIFGLGDHIYIPEPSQHFMFEKINHRYQKDSIAMTKALESPPPEQVTNKWLWALTKGKRKNSLKQEVAVDAPKNVEEMYKRTVIVMNIDTYSRDMSSVVDELRDAVSFILSQYHDKKQRIEMGDDLEIVVCLESPGGVVQEFGLAANQLERLTHAGYGRNDVSLTVCVDKIAASGGKSRRFPLNGMKFWKSLLMFCM